MSIYWIYIVKIIFHSFQLTQVTRRVGEVIISTKGVSGEIPEDGQSGIGSTPMGTLDQKGNKKQRKYGKITSTGSMYLPIHHGNCHNGSLNLEGGQKAAYV